MSDSESPENTPVPKKTRARPKAKKTDKTAAPASEKTKETDGKITNIDREIGTRDIEQNSTRYWRLNSIAGLQNQYSNAVEQPADPEAVTQRRNDFAMLRKLESREAAVLERAKKIFSFRTAAPEPEKAAAPVPLKPLRKELGKHNFDLKDVPQDFKDFVQTRFGTVGENLKAAASREGGSYKGPVVTSENYLAQKVKENSVVYHKKSDIELVSQNLQWRDSEKKLNGANIQFHYTGDKAKGYPHNVEQDKAPTTNGNSNSKAEAFSRMIEAQKAAAEKMNIPGLEQFKKNLDSVRDNMITQFRERPDQAQSRAPQPQRPPERHQHQSR